MMLGIEPVKGFEPKYNLLECGGLDTNPLFAPRQWPHDTTAAEFGRQTLRPDRHFQAHCVGGACLASPLDRSWRGATPTRVPSAVRSVAPAVTGSGCGPSQHSFS